jgi:hypothetical protein
LSANKQISFEGIQRFLRSIFGQDLHAKRILSLAGATLGAIESASLAVALIGRGLALARGLKTKYAIKQVDRMLANMAIDVDALLRHWVPFIVGKRPGITVAMDWTEFKPDGQATLMLSMLTSHGRATPLYWLTVDTATLTTGAMASNIKPWCAWPRPSLTVSRSSSWLIAASAIISCTAC